MVIWSDVNMYQYFASIAAVERDIVVTAVKNMWKEGVCSMLPSPISDTLLTGLGRTNANKTGF